MYQEPIFQTYFWGSKLSASILGTRDVNWHPLGNPLKTSSNLFQTLAIIVSTMVFWFVIGNLDCKP